MLGTEIFTNEAVMRNEEEESLFPSEQEKAWARGESIQGIDPGLMGARPSDFPVQHEGQEQDGESKGAAAVSPYLIPVAALLTGPLLAALVAFFADGRPPTKRLGILFLSFGALGWLLIQGGTAAVGTWLEPRFYGIYRVIVLVTIGALLYRAYTGSKDRRQGVDNRTLYSSAALLLLLSGLFWFAQDASWWAWLGR